MTAYVKSLNVLAENVRAQLNAVVAAGGFPQPDAKHLVSNRAALLLAQLDADCREVRADVERILETGEGF